MASWLGTLMQARLACRVAFALAACVCVGSSLARAATAGASAPLGHPAAAPKKGSAPAVPAKLVDINSAGRDELKTLPGIGDAQAAKIIAGRPYLTKTDLVTSNVLPTGVYISIKTRIMAAPAAKTGPKQ
jgi:competence protein ComEA